MSVRASLGPEEVKPIIIPRLMFVYILANVPRASNIRAGEPYSEVSFAMVMFRP